jgi:sterol desaturase/sphingolipid hydroxylase (fatty acid hydroxylase superfamily)
LINLAGRTLFGYFIPVSLAAPVFALAWQHRLTTLAIDSWQAVLLLFVGQEFCYYWFHRAAHRVRWFWASHSVHHTPNELNLSAAYRLGVFGRLAGSTVFYAPLVWLGFRPELVIVTYTLNLLYQFWIHTTWIPKLGWFEYVFNTPSAHRVHHAANLDYLDANYGGVLIIFDRLFGTYIAEREELPCRYGLVHPVTTYHPLRIEFHQWLPLLRDLLRARSLKAFFGYLLLPPGWKPNGEGETTEELRRRAGAASKQSVAALEI